MNANSQSLYRHVEFLTALRPFRNYQNLDSLEKVCCYLKAVFGAYGLEVVEQPYPHPELRELYPDKANFIAVVGKRVYHDFNQTVYELMKTHSVTQGETDGISRFSRLEFCCMLRFSDSAASVDVSPIVTSAMLPSPW